MRIKKRYGKDLNIIWKAKMGGALVTAGMMSNLSLVALDEFGSSYPLVISSVDGNGVHAKFEGEKHGKTGNYTLVLWYNRSQYTMLFPAFSLVTNTDEETDDVDYANNISVSVITDIKHSHA